MHRLKRLYLDWLPHHAFIVEAILPMLCMFVFFVPQVFAVVRFTDRSLFITDFNPGATSTYIVSFTYTTQTSVGSLDMLFCTDPIPSDPCTAPAGLNVSKAVLADQTGETGYSISTHTANHLVLTRTPGVVGNTPSTYTFSGIVNPTDTTHSFAIRLSDYASTDASGTLIDLGSVLTQTNVGVTIQTQVPPILIFCVAQQVSDDCSNESGGNYTDMGTLSSSHTLTATSQMAAGTNASSGYVITVNGPPMEAGTNVINPLGTPTASVSGSNQFGINLVANNAPNIGGNPDGAFANANPMPDYAAPNKFMYQDGSAVASAPNVSLVRRFTVSYIVNAAANLRAGVYTTTLTYVCTGRF